MQGCIVKSGAVVENAIVDRRNIIDCDTIIKGTAEKKIIIPKKETR